MTSIRIFTGNAGAGVATAAAASALGAADAGQKTLLLSLGPPLSLGALLGLPIDGTPAEVAPGLDALAIDGLGELASAWERQRARLPAGMAQISGDELPALPGLELAFGLLRLRELAPRYDLVTLDAGPHDLLLRALAAPDGLRWAVRLLFGLDRGPGRASASLARALLPTSFIPGESYDNVQEARVEAERLRELLIAPGAAAVCYVLRPDQPALAEARIGVPALQLHGLAVAAIALGPLLPGGMAGTPLAALAEQQITLATEVAAIWPGRPQLRFELAGAGTELAGLRAAGQQLGQLDALAANAPIANSWAGAPALAIELPGLPKNALQLTISGDELIVRVGAYRRHILLPEGLRGVSDIKATREGDRLIVRKRI